MSRRGTCVACGRVEVSITGRGRCSGCYRREREREASGEQRVASGEERGAASGEQRVASGEERGAAGAVLTLRFAGDDQALLTRLGALAARRRRTPEAQALWMLEAHLAELPDLWEATA